jgi:hypothetical protein
MCIFAMRLEIFFEKESMRAYKKCITLYERNLRENVEHTTVSAIYI